MEELLLFVVVVSMGEVELLLLLLSKLSQKEMEDS
jgi:hypothetical protein